MYNVLLFGGSGMVGKAIQRKFCNENIRLIVPSHEKLDLECENSVDNFCLEYEEYWNGTDLVINCSGFVGGVNFNRKNRIDSYRKNNNISLNLLTLIEKIDCKRIIDIGSVCMYPSAIYCSNGIAKEEMLFDVDVRDLDSDMAGYGLAKLHSFQRYNLLNDKMGLNFCYLIPTNLYGIGDKFDERANVIPALINKYIEWINRENEEVSQGRLKMQGNGENKRDFLYIDDFAEIIITFMYDILKRTICKAFNVCTGKEHSIKNVWNEICNNFKYEVPIEWGEEDGIIRKPMSNEELLDFLGNYEFTCLKDGLKKMIEWYKKQRINENIVRL